MSPRYQLESRLHLSWPQDPARRKCGRLPYHTAADWIELLILEGSMRLGTAVSSRTERSRTSDLESCALVPWHASDRCQVERHSWLGRQDVRDCTGILITSSTDSPLPIWGTAAATTLSQRSNSRWRCCRVPRAAPTDGPCSPRATVVWDGC
ncbi:hypothetical protein OH77DRAFT_607832 [Trametes cingulata]|nr:hypothetical protein OH77DRAFT_607832 [Trametes cingulata]